MASGLSDGNIIVTMAMSAWLSALVGALVKWEVLTEEEQAILMAQVKSDVEQEREEIERRQAESEHSDEDEVTRSLIQTQGI